MKTNPMARGIRRIRLVVVCVALLGLTGGAFMLGQALGNHFGQYAVPSATVPAAPNVSLAEIMSIIPS